MPEELILADSSIWIPAFREKKNPSWLQEFQSLLINRRIAIAPPIQLELLSGARTEKEYHALAQELDALSVLEITPAVWKEAGRMAFRLRQKGITVPTVDLLIAATALFYHCTLYYHDRHFLHIAKHTPLKTKTLESPA